MGSDAPISGAWHQNARSSSISFCCSFCSLSKRPSGPREIVGKLEEEGREGMKDKVGLRSGDLIPVCKSPGPFLERRGLGKGRVGCCCSLPPSCPYQLRVYEHPAHYPLGSAHSALRVGQKCMILDQSKFTSTFLILSKLSSLNLTSPMG